MSNKSMNRIVGTLKPGQTEEAATGRQIVEGLASNSVQVWKWSSHIWASADLGAVFDSVIDYAERVNRGNLGDQEALLAGQLASLNAVYAKLLFQAHESKMVDHYERYLRLAFKAQAQCRATCEALSLLKNPPVFARQANIAHGPQQVNNAVAVGGTPSRAEDLKTKPIELLEVQSERMDPRASSKAGSGNQTLATMGAIKRPAKRRG